MPGFTGKTRATLSLPCTYDLEVAAAKYFHALRGGTIPLQFLFSGTIFGSGEQALQVRPVSWNCEDHYDMPIAVWRDLIALHYPNSGWLRLSHASIAARANFGIFSIVHAVSAQISDMDELCKIVNNLGR